MEYIKSYPKCEKHRTTQYSLVHVVLEMVSGPIYKNSHSIYARVHIIHAYPEISHANISNYKSRS